MSISLSELIQSDAEQRHIEAKKDTPPENEEPVHIPRFMEEYWDQAFILLHEGKGS